MALPSNELVRVLNLNLSKFYSRSTEFRRINSMAKEQPKKEDEPLYYIEDGLYVFTEAYHLKRGYCCQSGCRHCPYGFRKGEATK